uniref:Transmembrane protein n=1 Tax=Medicago truncatula TaxID=3880 RepID=Q2HV17_MEDTR|nr:hypothetical protein MtrDRAFT_AC149032g30v2 [Medicago truncatula]
MNCLEVFVFPPLVNRCSNFFDFPGSVREKPWSSDSYPSRMEGFTSSFYFFSYFLIFLYLNQ